MEKSIAVIGDACCDVFIYCNCSRLCPEAPVPVLDVCNQVTTLGMAGNVFRNITNLKGQAGLISNENLSEVTKTRYVEKKTNHMFFRIDSNVPITRIKKETIDGLRYDTLSAIVISDYNKGFLFEEDISEIAKRHPVTFLDTKKQLGPWAKDIKFIKINRLEYKLSKPYLTTDLKDKIIETLGDGGCSYQGKIYPVKKVDIKDLSGAGDTFLAGLVVKYLQTNNIEESLIYANGVATIVVQKMGVSMVFE